MFFLADLMVMIVSHEHNDHNGGLNTVMEANPTLEQFISSRETFEKIQILGTPNYSNSRVQEIFASNPTFPKYPTVFDLLIEDLRKHEAEKNECYVFTESGKQIERFYAIFEDLNANVHLDTAYGGYAVFARVKDEASFQVVDAIAAAVQEKGRVGIREVVVQ